MYNFYIDFSRWTHDPNPCNPPGLLEWKEYKPNSWAIFETEEFFKWLITNNIKDYSRKNECNCPTVWDQIITFKAKDSAVLFQLTWMNK